MSALLVRRRDIEAGAGRAGAFSGVEYLNGLLPDRLLSPLAVFCVDTRERVVALTYDDGPDPSSTPGVLEVLRSRGAHATFFVLGERARRHPDVIRRIVQEGHELALHGMDHRSLPTMSAAEALRSTREARAIVEDVAGQRVRLYRPPYGSYTLRQAIGVRRLGLELVLWSGDAQDWIDDDESAVAERATDAIFPGGILLLHDTRGDPETLGPDERLPTFDRGRVLGRILARAEEGGYTCTTVSRLISRFPSVKSISRQNVVGEGGVRALLRPRGPASSPADLR